MAVRTRDDLSCWVCKGKAWTYDGPGNFRGYPVYDRWKCDGCGQVHELWKGREYEDLGNGVLITVDVFEKGD
jgi:hypothetical protein